MPWVYWQHLPHAEVKQGPFVQQAEALLYRSLDEDHGIRCSGIYWSNFRGTSTARHGAETPPATLPAPAIALPAPAILLPAAVARAS